MSIQKMFLVFMLMLHALHIFCDVMQTSINESISGRLDLHMEEISSQRGEIHTVRMEQARMGVGCAK